MGTKECRKIIAKYEIFAEDDTEEEDDGEQEKASKKRKTDKTDKSANAKTEDRPKKTATKRAKMDVLVTSYEVLMQDSSLLKKIDWEVLTIDEGHRLKNKDCRLFHQLFPFSTHHRIVLTGTPLQNELPELFSLLRFLQIEPFVSNADFEEQVQQFSVWNQKSQIEKLHEKLRPHMLRRLKSDVLSDIPPKSEYIVRVEMTQLQKQYYKGILSKNYHYLQHAAKVGVSALRNILVSLCKICNHPYLFPDSEPDTENSDEQNQRLIETSGKLQLLDRMLPFLQKDNHRVIIFSQMTHMLDILEDWLDYRNVPFTRVDGRVSGPERQSRIDQFNKENSPYFAMLCSTRACRLGINLTSADTVIIYDSDWNPHNDLQALSRAHRIGQTNKVMVYQLVCVHSVEEKIIMRAQQKLMLEHLVVRKMKDEFKDGELDDILRYGAKELFAEEEGGSVDQKFQYDDEAISKLLDRTQTSMVEKQTEQNAYLNSFQVSRVWETEAHTTESGETSPREDEKEKEADEEKFWNSLLQQRIQQAAQEEQDKLGKGKRKRMPIKYDVDKDASSSDEKDEDWAQDGLSSSEEEDEGELEDEDDEYSLATPRKKADKQDDKKNGVEGEVKKRGRKKKTEEDDPTKGPKKRKVGEEGDKEEKRGRKKGSRERSKSDPSAMQAIVKQLAEADGNRTEEHKMSGSSDSAISNANRGSNFTDYYNRARSGSGSSTKLEPPSPELLSKSHNMHPIHHPPSFPIHPATSYPPPQIMEPEYFSGDGRYPPNFPKYEHERPRSPRSTYNDPYASYYSKSEERLPPPSYPSNFPQPPSYSPYSHPPSPYSPPRHMPPSRYNDSPPRHMPPSRYNDYPPLPHHYDDYSLKDSYNYRRPPSPEASPQKIGSLSMLLNPASDTRASYTYRVRAPSPSIIDVDSLPEIRSDLYKYTTTTRHDDRSYNKQPYLLPDPVKSSVMLPDPIPPKPPSPFKIHPNYEHFSKPKSLSHFFSDTPSHSLPPYSSSSSHGRYSPPPQHHNRYSPPPYQQQSRYSPEITRIPQSSNSDSQPIHITDRDTPSPPLPKPPSNFHPLRFPPSKVSHSSAVISPIPLVPKVPLDYSRHHDDLPFSAPVNRSYSPPHHHPLHHNHHHHNVFK